MQLVLPIRPHENQLPIIHPQARFNVIAAGRRYGKTESQKLRAIYMVLDGKSVWWVNPTFDNTTETWRDFMAFFEPVAIKIDRSRREIILPNGGSIRMIGANNFKRGSGIDHIFIDEAAFCDLGDLWQYQLRPMLLDNPNTGATFLSSTNGRNMFWQLYLRGQDPQEPEWASHHYTSYDNPRINPSELDSIKRNTPERVFNQEYMAVFLEDGGAVFRNITACTDDTLVIDKERGIYPGVVGRIVMGADLGRHEDYTVIYAIDTETRRIVDYDRFTDISWDIQATRITAMANRWTPQVIWMEENFNDSFVERLQGDGLPISAYRTTHQSKQQIVNQLALAFEQGDITIPNDTTLIGELQAYTVERLPSGNLRYTAPAGLHDDCVMALALAWHGVLEKPATVVMGYYA